MNMKNKKILTLALAIVMVAAMAACGSKPNSSSSSMSESMPSSPASDSASSLPETSESQPADTSYDATAQSYLSALTGARDDELNSAYGVITHDSALNMNSFRNNYTELKKEDGTAYTEEEMMADHDNQRDMMFGMLGFTPEDVESYAISVSPINIKAYGIAVVKPVAGKEETVVNGLNAFLDTQRKNFETYLQDQYEIAKAGYVKTLEDGTVVMVLTENQDTVYDSITKGLTAK